MNKKNNSIEDILSNRIFIVAVIFFISFLVLLSKLFTLQIINGESYSRNLVNSTVKTLSIPAERGTIYDAYGVPLATNQTSYTVTFDPSVSLNNQTYNEVCYNLINLFNRNGDEYVDSLPISKTEPYTFLFTSDSREKAWKRDMSIPESKYDMGPDETMAYLEDLFDIDPTLDNSMKREIISLRTAIYMERYKKYNLVTLAYDVSDETIAELQEQSTNYPGISVTSQVQRVYPMGRYVSHTIGYTGSIDQEELEDLNKETTDKYDQNDVIGKTGLESAFESDLRGKDGAEVVEANSTGRVVNILDTTEPVSGNNIYTTIDSNLQEKAYYIIEDVLTDVLINKLNAVSPRDANITTQDFFSSFILANNFDAYDIYNNTEDTYAMKVDAIVSANHPDDDLYDYPTYSKALNEEYINGNISEHTLLMLMLEEGIITPDDELKNKIINQSESAKNLIIELLEAGEITPQMTNLDPCTASVVMVDIDTGDVILSANYPSYDDNRLANDFDNNYYYKLIVLDPTLPLTNRAFQEQRAPGSTFKMLTAVAGLETGAITPTTKVYDEVTFKKAGLPYSRCWSSYSHGSIDVAKALEVSCNYFFLNTVYLMGNPDEGTDEQALETMEKYSDLFGFNERTGVEIGEAADMYPDDLRITSSPEYKEYMYTAVNPDISPSEYQWYFGDTIRTGIGQGLNNYTAGSMAKYVATLVNGGDRYQLHFLSQITSPTGDILETFVPNLELTVPMSDSTYDTVLQGMWQAVYGTSGTAKKTFVDFPIEVGGKTGTAQEGSRSDHSAFAGFAPYDDPEVAIYVAVPYGKTYSGIDTATTIARDILGAYFYIDYEPTDNSNQTNTFVK